MWNLKNYGKIKEFDEIKKIALGVVNSNFYSVIVTSDGVQHVFDLSKVYSPIPSILNDKKFDVSPNNHQIDVSVNKETSLIATAINKSNKNSDDKPIKKEDELANEEVDNKMVIEEVIKPENPEEEKKEEIMEKFEENILEKMEEKGLEIEDPIEEKEE